MENPATVIEDNTEKVESPNEESQNLIYFEKQQNNRLCGMHCLNSLM